MARPAGIEPAVLVLETSGLPLTDGRMRYSRILTDSDDRFKQKRKAAIRRLSSLGFLVRDVLLAELAELRELKAPLQLLLVLVSVIIHALTLRALHFREIVLRHNSIDFWLILSDGLLTVKESPPFYHGEENSGGAGGGDQTHDLRFTKALLYH